MATVGAEEPSIRETLVALADRLTTDLAELFGHEDATASLHDEDRLRLVLQGQAGRFELGWPPREAMTEAKGHLGAHARIALELHLASQAPAKFFEGYRPVSPERRAYVFERLTFYIEDSLGETGYYDPMIVEQRGPVLLVFSDDEYVLVSETGQRRGTGILDWKVKRLVAYALTDADERFST